MFKLPMTLASCQINRQSRKTKSTSRIHRVCYVGQIQSIFMFNALIRTHHITSRKKVAALKTAAKRHDCFALLRYGGIPGVMYVEGRDKMAVQNWVDTVHGLRYKDYQLAAAVAEVAGASSEQPAGLGTLQEVDTVKELGARMDRKGLTKWWRNAMGYAHD